VGLGLLDLLFSWVPCFGGAEWVFYVGAGKQKQYENI
jgi:hypothetical protein